MLKKLVISILTVFLVVAIIVLFAPKADNRKPSNNSESKQSDQVKEKGVSDETSANKPAASEQKAAPEPAKTIKSDYSNETDIMDTEVSIEEVNYDGKSFQPSKLEIKTGDIVIFRNKSDKGFWPASGPHPKHTNYPEFDAKSSIAPGQSFEFKFIKAGTWAYHDHLNASSTGTIVVK